MLGCRVVVRHALGRPPDRPRYSDVVGHLVSVDAGELVLRRADGDLVTVSADRVHRIKPVPPRPVRVSRAEVLALAELSARGWPAPDTHWMGGWLLRAGGGFTGRANSVLPLADPPGPLSDALPRVESWYAARRLPARFCVPLPVRADLDAALGAAGYVADRHPTYVLTAELAGVLAAAGNADPAGGAEPDGIGITLKPTPDPGWLAGYHRLGRAPLPGVAIQILAGHPRVVFASARRDGRTVAVARAVVDDGWAGVSAVEVQPRYRRRGLARRLMAATLDWAGRQGASQVYLQVTSDNLAALALYDRLGFARHHRYHYRVQPVRPTPPG